MNIDRTLHGTNSLNSSLVRQFKEPLSENDIIFLQDKFLIQGLHLIKVINFKSGRSIIKTILKSLNCFKNVAYLSESNDPEFINLFDSIKNLNNQYDFQDYFFYEFNYDFIWIENSENNLIKLFNRQISEFNIDKIISIIHIYN